MASWWDLEACQVVGTLCNLRAHWFRPARTRAGWQCGRRGMSSSGGVYVYDMICTCSPVSESWLPQAILLGCVNGHGTPGVPTPRRGPQGGEERNTTRSTGTCAGQ